MKDNNATNPSELAGSIVSSDKPIAVTLRGTIQTQATDTSNYTDQLVPSDQLGKDYVVLKGNSVVDVAYLMAPLNATGFTVTSASGSSSWLINSMESYSINISDPIYYIKSDRPVYLFHVSGYGRKLSGAQLAPVYCAGSYSTAFTRISSDSLNLNICTRSGFQSTFTLTSNGTNIPVSSSAFTTVPGTSGALVTARIYLPSSSVPVGSYNELKNSGDIFGLSVLNGVTEMAVPMPRPVIFQ